MTAMQNPKCQVCGGAMVESKTTFTLAKDSSVYVVRNVPCLECNDCEHVIFGQETAKKLELLVGGRVEPIRRSMVAWVYHWDDPIHVISAGGEINEIVFTPTGMPGTADLAPV